jgi:pyridoxamine 5'-phosphate oxidase family protein
VTYLSPAEIEYLARQPLGRIATVGDAGDPHVVPVSFTFDEATGTVDVVGHNLVSSKKWKDLTRNPAVSIVVDDVLPPWRPRGIEFRGTAELDAAAPAIRIRPRRVIAWGIDTDAYSPVARTVDVGP